MPVSADQKTCRWYAPASPSTSSVRPVSRQKGSTSVPEWSWSKAQVAKMGRMRKSIPSKKSRHATRSSCRRASALLWAP